MEQCAFLSTDPRFNGKLVRLKEPGSQSNTRFIECTIIEAALLAEQISRLLAPVAPVAPVPEPKPHDPSVNPWPEPDPID